MNKPQHNVDYYGPKAQRLTQAAKVLLEEALDAAVRAGDPPLASALSLSLAALIMHPAMDAEANPPIKYQPTFPPTFPN
jgi:hypothetical protein